MKGRLNWQSHSTGSRTQWADSFNGKSRGTDIRPYEAVALNSPRNDAAFGSQSFL
jgi:hypothetical protein